MGFEGKFGGLGGTGAVGTCGTLGTGFGFGVGNGGSGGKVGGSVALGFSGVNTATAGPTLAFVVGKLGSDGITGTPGICSSSDTAFFTLDPNTGSAESTMPKHCAGSTHIKGVCRSMTVPLLHSQPSPAQVGGQA